MERSGEQWAGYAHRQRPSTRSRSTPNSATEPKPAAGSAISPTACARSRAPTTPTTTPDWSPTPRWTGASAKGSHPYWPPSPRAETSSARPWRGYRLSRSSTRTAQSRSVRLPARRSWTSTRGSSGSRRASRPRGGYRPGSPSSTRPSEGSSRASSRSWPDARRWGRAASPDPSPIPSPPPVTAFTFFPWRIRAEHMRCECSPIIRA